MKKNYILVFILFYAAVSSFGQAIQTNYINYQGVARDAENQLMANESLTLGIALKLGGVGETPAYSENHVVTTDANGVFSLKIGNGDVINGDYANFPWGNLATYVTVSINGIEVGTTEMSAVPYALSSGDGAQQADEVPYDNTASGLSANNTQDAIDELVGSGTIDADADPTNEIQTISFDPTSNQISLTDGGTITIPSGGTDADADPTNEFQTLSFDVGTNELSLSDGNAITIPSGGTDADADPTNEIQTISFDATSNEISLTDGGTITIPSGGTDADADPTNEIQTLSFDVGTNELSLSDGNSITIPSGGTDADADPTNELQTISFDAASNEISLTDGGTITIPSGGTDADADPTNEFQTLSFDAGTNELSLTDGNTISIPTGGTDADADPTNEIQTISFDAASNEITLTDGGTIIIPSGGTDADADPTNELQDISLSGTELTISDGSTIDLAPIVPPGGSDDQNLVLTGDVLSIEGGTGSVDLSDYRSTDTTTQSGLLLGDGTAVSGLEGTADGQVPKWDAATSSWAAGTDATGTGGSSLWTENGNNITYEGGLVGIGTPSPSSNFEVSGEGDVQQRISSTNGGNPNVQLYRQGNSNVDWTMSGGSGALSFLYSNDDLATAFKHTEFKENGDLNVFGGIESQDLQGTGQRNVMANADGKLVIGSGGSGSSLWSEDTNGINFIGNIGIGAEADPFYPLEITTDTGVGLSLNSTSNFNYIAYTNSSGYIGYAGSFNGGEDMDFGTGGGNLNGKVHIVTNSSPKLSVAANGDVGIGITNPQTKLDIVGGQWDLNNTSGDFRIGSDLQGLRIGVATGIGPGGGDVRLRAQGGTDRLFIGAGNEDVMTVTPGNVAVNGNVNITGEVNRPATGNANMVPIAYGAVRQDGIVMTGSGNFTVTKSGVGAYLISINGELSAEINVSIGSLDNPGFIRIVGLGTDLGVATFDISGDRKDEWFNFVTYKP
jgi:hypothetical protein